MRTTLRLAPLACAVVSLAHGSGVEPLVDSQATATAWFVVAEIVPFHNDSYVLALDDPAHIAHARQLIAEGPGPGLGHIVVAQITPGADGINRNVVAPGQPLWSWHVSRFEQFAEATIEICDGWPTFVEEDIDGWIANTGGRICFWQYTVVDELASPVHGSVWGDVKRLYR